MRLSFGRYGGEYCVGSLNHIEVSNISELLKRFDKSIIVGNYETNFDTNDYKENFFDFNDIEHLSSAALEATIWIEKSGDYKLEEDYFSSDDCNVVITEEPTLPDGYYIVSNSIEKGSFFHVDLEINPDEFVKSKLTLECKDMDGVGFGDYLITNVLYDGKELEMDYDSCNTNGKGFEQNLICVEGKYHLDGAEQLYDALEQDDMLDVIEDINGMEETEAIQNYLSYVEAQRNDYLIKTDEIILFASPFLYKHFDKDEVDALWMTEKNIKFALKNDYQTEIPEDVWERIIGRFPEWLI